MNFNFRNIAVLIFWSFCLVGQEAKDTIRISEVKIIHEPLISNEHAGLEINQVDSATLQENVGNDLGTMLSANSAIFIKSEGRGAFSSASFRGTSSSHTQVTWNGINLNSPLVGQVDFSLLPMFAFDEINVLHGGASITEGSGGLGGAIQINQSFHPDTSMSIKTNVGYGSFDTHHELIGLVIPKGKWQSETKIYNIQSENDYRFINRGILNVTEEGALVNPLDTNHNGAYRFKGIMQELYYQPKSNHLISAVYWGQINDRSIPRATSYEGPENHNLNRQHLEDHKGQIAWKQWHKKTTIEISSSAILQKSNYYRESLVNGLGIVPSISAHTNQRTSANIIRGEYRFSEDFKATLLGKLNYHSLEISDSIHDQNHSFSRFEALPLLTLSYGKKRWSSQLMLRQEYIDNQWMPFIPYASFEAQPIKKWPIKWSINGGRNFRWPTISDLHWQPGGNPELLPEHGWNGETGLTHLYQKKTFNLKSSAHYFYNAIQNWILWTPSFQGYWEPMNLNRVVSQGAEISLSGTKKWEQWWTQFQMNYAYTKATNYHDATNNSYGKQLVYIPVHSGNLNVRIGYKDLYVRYQNNSYSERFTTSSNDVNRRDWLYPYFMNNLAIGGKFNWKELKFNSELAIQNVLNETYHSVLYRPMPGLNYLFSLQIQYRK